MTAFDCWSCTHLEKRCGGFQYCLLSGGRRNVDANKDRCEYWMPERDYDILEYYSDEKKKRRFRVRKLPLEKNIWFDFPTFDSLYDAKQYIREIRKGSIIHYVDD